MYPPPEPQRKQEDQKIPVIFQDFSEVSKQLKALADERQRVNDLLSTFSQIDLDIKILADKTESNLKQTMDIKNYVVQRLKALDSLEAKWSLLLQRVDGVLQELERVLKQM